jgi:DNA polymerase phi
MRCLINHISQEDRFLHRAAEKCLKSLLQAVEADANLVEIVIPRLISHSGVYNFDQVTKTKTVDKLLSLLKGERAHIVIRDLLKPIMDVKT